MELHLHNELPRADISQQFCEKSEDIRDFLSEAHDEFAYTNPFSGYTFSRSSGSHVQEAVGASSLYSIRVHPHPTLHGFHAGTALPT